MADPVKLVNSRRTLVKITSKVMNEIEFDWIETKCHKDKSIERTNDQTMEDET